MCATQSGLLRDVPKLYREEKREEGDIGDQEDKKGGIKTNETDPASNQFPKCSPPSGTHRDSQSWIEKRWGRKETEATWWRKGESKGGESGQASNLALR